QFNRLPETDAQRKQLIVSTTAALEEFERKNTDAMVALSVALRAAEAGHQTGDLVLMARSLSRTNAGAAQSARRIVDALAANPAVPFAREILASATESAVRADHRSKIALDSF